VVSSPEAPSLVAFMATDCQSARRKQELPGGHACRGSSCKYRVGSGIVSSPRRFLKHPYKSGVLVGKSSSGKVDDVGLVQVQFDQKL
jgi:hypothetical protein